MREQRSQWADSSLDAFFASAMKPNFCNLPMSRLGGFSGQVILPLAHTFDPEEVSSYPTYNLNSLTQFNKVLILNALFVALLFQFLEVIKLGNASTYQDALMHRDLFLLQVTLVPLLHHCDAPFFDLDQDTLSHKTYLSD